MRQNQWAWLVCISLVVLGFSIWSDQQTVSRGWERLDRIEYPQPRVCTAGDNGDSCIYGMFVGVETY